jgi:hypothetical protein
MKKPEGREVIIYNAKQILDYIEEKYKFNYYDYVFHIIVNAMLFPIRGAITLTQKDIPILEKNIVETGDPEIKTKLFIVRDYMTTILDEFNINGEVWLSNDINPD